MNKFIKKIKEHSWKEQWNIAVGEADAKSVVENGLGKTDLQWLFKEKKNGFYADPFCVKHQDDFFLFFEEYDYSTDRGVISVSKLKKEKKTFSVDVPRVVIEESFHLSYPFVFEKKGEFFMIPEAAQSERVTLYRATDFPLKWKKEKVLLENIQALDTTFLQHDGLFWMFCTLLDKGENNALYAFFADDIFGDWKPHRQNPIKIDLGSARPAGNVFEVGDELFRPSQNSKGTYGKNIVVNRINKLTPDIFDESKEREITPCGDSKYQDGMHSINFCDNFVFVDGKRFCGIKKFADPVYSKYFKK